MNRYTPGQVHRRLHGNSIAKGLHLQAIAIIKNKKNVTDSHVVVFLVFFCNVGTSFSARNNILLGGRKYGREVGTGGNSRAADPCAERGCISGCRCCKSAQVRLVVKSVCVLSKMPGQTV